MLVIKSANYDGCCFKLRSFEHVHSAKPIEYALVCSHLGGVWGHAPTEDFLRIYPSEVKSGVNLDQKLLDQLR